MSRAVTNSRQLYTLGRRDDLVHYWKDKTRMTGGNVMPNYYTHPEFISKKLAKTDRESAMTILLLGIVLYFVLE